MADIIYDGMTLGELMESILWNKYSISPSEATAKQVYNALCGTVQNILSRKRKEMNEKIANEEAKQVYYLSMEFLIGKSLRNNLSNLGLTAEAEDAVKKCGLELDMLYDMEPDAALGNGGLGRLAACYMDSAAVMGYPATGYTILYEYGIFKQLIENCRQAEAPDAWLDGGRVWLEERRDRAVEVPFGGQVLEQWYGTYHHAEHVNYDTVIAVPYDMYISGYGSDSVSRLRLWSAESPGIDMESFNRGDYAAAMLKNSTAELISKILYPNDNQIDGKMLRLRQQYFMCCASVSDIVTRHLERYGTMENLADKVAIHVNDTHPTLAIPELMKILLDDCGYGWDDAMRITRNCFAYTNHTILTEALERWNADLLRRTAPRVYEIIEEIDRNLQRDAASFDAQTQERMRIISGGEVRMANLCAYMCHNVNGVSALHSEIVKGSLFSDFARLDSDKFVNVTNGIAYRRWLLQGNPGLTELATQLIGERFKKDAGALRELLAYKDDAAVLGALAGVKLENKRRFAGYVRESLGRTIDPLTVFDVQAKRIHEYKRQHLNALCIVRRYLDIVNGRPNSYIPRTYLFSGKAAPGYYIAKEMIRLICTLERFLTEDVRSRDLLSVCFLPNYRVSLSEMLMPAAEVSEQISLAGKEASGTGNMKLMLGGALTVGTLDGANVEIREAAGEENFFLFGMTKEEVEREKCSYDPSAIYAGNSAVAEVLDFIASGALGDDFTDLVNNLRYSDPYMVLKDFESYCGAQCAVDEAYTDSLRWNRMSLCNIAASGRFSADRSVREYSENIWGLERLV